MRKDLILLLLAVISLASCGNKKSKDLNYNGRNPIVIALRDTLPLDVTSDYDIKVTSSNTTYVTVNGTCIFGKNVGNADITMDNSYNSTTVPVEVQLFVEPSFNFGCSQAEIKKLHGNPYINFGDTLYVYGEILGENAPGLSMACWQMDYFFNYANQYYLSDVYIKKNPDLEYLFNKYMTDNFVFDSTYHPSDTLEYFMYHNKQDSHVKCGMYYNANQWEDICLFYYYGNQKCLIPKHHELKRQSKGFSSR